MDSQDAMRDMQPKPWRGRVSNPPLHALRQNGLLYSRGSKSPDPARSRSVSVPL